MTFFFFLFLLVKIGELSDHFWKFTEGKRGKKIEEKDREGEREFIRQVIMEHLAVVS